MAIPCKWPMHVIRVFTCMCYGVNSSHSVQISRLKLSFMITLTVLRQSKHPTVSTLWLVFQILLLLAYHWPVPLNKHLHHYRCYPSHFRTNPPAWKQQLTQEWVPEQWYRLRNLTRTHRISEEAVGFWSTWSAGKQIFATALGFDFAYTAGGRAPALSFVVLLLTVLCRTGR